ncbi:hypothetical protein Bca4012_074328 [Brassica carinata]
MAIVLFSTDKCCSSRRYSLAFPLRSVIIFGGGSSGSLDQRCCELCPVLWRAISVVIGLSDFGFQRPCVPCRFRECVVDLLIPTCRKVEFGYSISEVFPRLFKEEVAYLWFGCGQSL